MPILLVEDEPAVVQALTFVLEQEGYAVLTAPNGAAALEIVQNQPTDLVILDLWMPVMNGWEFLGRLRSLQSPTRDVPVIAVSADVNAGSRALPVQSFMTKPMDIDKLLETVREHLPAA